VSNAFGVEALAAYGDALAMQMCGHGHAVDTEPDSEFVDARPGQVTVGERRDLTV